MWESFYKLLFENVILDRPFLVALFFSSPSLFFSDWLMTLMRHDTEFQNASKLPLSFWIHFIGQRWFCLSGISDWARHAIKQSNEGSSQLFFSSTRQQQVLVVACSQHLQRPRKTSYKITSLRSIQHKKKSLHYRMYQQLYEITLISCHPAIAN